MKKNYFKDLMSRILQLNYKTYFAIVLLLSFGTSFFNAQVSAYNFSQSNSTFSSISNGTVLGVATGNTSATNLNSNVYPVSIPFVFNFNGQNYTSLNVSTNGYLTFGTTPPTASGAAPISATTAYDGAISAFGHSISSFFDILGKTGDISWETTGSSPNREVVIQWTNFRPTSTTSTTSVYALSFQIRLQETTNNISVVYSDGSYLVGSTAYSSATNQVGLRGATNADFNNRFNTAANPYVSSVTGSANGDDQAFSTVNSTPGMPSPGLMYTWTPATCLGPISLGVSNITTNSATLSWGASVSNPANGYDIYYSTSNVAPLSTTTPTISGVAGLTQSLSSLTPASTYYVWVRSVCTNTDASNWTALPTFNTQCAPINNLFENFDSYATGSVVPNCWDRIVGTGTQTISATTPNSTPNNLYMFSSSPANQTIVVLPVLGNINAGTHWLRFKARVTTAPRTIDVGYVSNATDASTFVTIESKSISNTDYTSLDSEYTIVIPTTLPAGARLAIRNPGIISTTFYFDDIYWELSPTCFPPGNVAISNIGPSTANISWTASITPPANGYQIYYSTNNTPPTASTVPKATNIAGTSTNISGLTAVTGYFVWVRSSCSSSDISTWTTVESFTTACQPPALLTTNGATVCPNNSATLSATADPGATVQWYDAAGTLLFTGSSYTTPPLAATTTYYATAAVGSSNLSVGKSTISTGSTSGLGTTNFGLVFDVFTPSILTSVTIYPFSATSASGTVIIDIIDSNGNIVHTKTENVVGSPTTNPLPHIATLNFPLLPGTNFKIRPRSYTGIGGLRFDPSSTATGGNHGFPYNLAGILNINTSTLTAAPTNTPRNDLYYYFYDWKVSSKCESAQQPVVATVDAACLSTSEVTKDDVKVYPNPFTDVINISDVKGLLSIEVTDLSGRLVKTISKPATQINLSDLNTGMYLLTLKYKNGNSKTIKAIKK